MRKELNKERGIIMFKDWSDRQIAEEASQELLDEMTPEEIAEMVRRQEFERSQDYWEAPFKALWEMDEALKD